MSRNKKPLYVMVALASVLVFSLFNYFSSVSSLKDDYKDFVIRREKRLLFYLQAGESFGRADQLEELARLLEQARLVHDVDFFVIQYKGKPLFFGSSDGQLGALADEYPIGQTVITPSSSLKRVLIRKDTTLMVGVNKDINGYVDAMTLRYRGLLFEHALELVGLALAVFIFYMKDLVGLVSTFSSRDRKAIGLVKTHSRESEVLAQGLLGYEKALHDLYLTNEIFGRQVLPSLKKEVLSGKKPPYDFECTMVRTDINNFSIIYNQHDVTEFMSTINEFFKQVSHVVSGYKGLVHEFVGDEVIFYFKDEEHENSFSTALAAVWDINQIATQVSTKTFSTQGYPFTVKSSLAHGKVRFGALVNGYSLAGAVLIETVRILSRVVEKDGNVIFFGNAHRNRVAPIFETRETMKVALKGFSGLRSLHGCIAKKPLQDILSSLSAENVALLNYYRQESEICELLSFLAQATIGSEGQLGSHPQPVNLLLEVVRILKNFQVTEPSKEISDKLVGWLEGLGDFQRDSEKWGQLGAKEQKALSRLLSSAVTLCLNLLTQESFTEFAADRMEELAKRAGLRQSRREDSRFLANVVEVLTHFKTKNVSETTRNWLENEDRRVAANALLQEGRRDLSPFVLKRLEKMLKEEESALVASGLFVLGELASYYRRTNRVYFQSNLRLQSLCSRLDQFAASSDSHVRTQCYRAIQKVDDPNLTAKLWLILGHPDRKSYRDEASAELAKAA